MSRHTVLRGWARHGWDRRKGKFLCAAAVETARVTAAGISTTLPAFSPAVCGHGVDTS